MSSNTQLYFTNNVITIFLLAHYDCLGNDLGTNTSYDTRERSSVLSKFNSVCNWKQGPYLLNWLNANTALNAFLVQIRPYWLAHAFIS